MTTALQNFVLRFTPTTEGPVGVFREDSDEEADLLTTIARSIYAGLPLSAYGNKGRRARSVNAYFELARDSKEQLNAAGSTFAGMLHAIALAGVEWTGGGHPGAMRERSWGLDKIIPAAMVATIPPLSTELRLSSSVEDVRRFYVDAAWNSSLRTAELMLDALDACVWSRLVGVVEFIRPADAIVVHRFRRTGYVGSPLWCDAWHHPVEDLSDYVSAEITGLELTDVRPLRGRTPERVWRMMDATPEVLKARVTMHTGHAIRKITRLWGAGPRMSETVVYHPVSFAALDRRIVLASWADGHHGSLLRLLGVR